MVSLIDTNIIIRFLVKEDSDLYRQSIEIIEQIDQGTLQVEILSEVVMEILFIMTKYYEASLKNVVEDIKVLLLMEGVVNQDKYILFDALNMMVEKKIDFVDALICTKTKLQGYDWISFDTDLVRHCPRR